MNWLLARSLDLVPMNWLLGTQLGFGPCELAFSTQGRFSVNVPHGFLSSWGVLGTRGGFLMIVLQWFLHLSRLLGTGRRFPVIVLHRSEKSGRTNLMKVTAVPNCPEYSENEGEQTWWKGSLCLIARNTARIMENKLYRSLWWIIPELSAYLRRDGTAVVRLICCFPASWKGQLSLRWKRDPTPFIEAEPPLFCHSILILLN